MRGVEFAASFGKLQVQQLSESCCISTILIVLSLSENIML